MAVKFALAASAAFILHVNAQDVVDPTTVTITMGTTAEPPTTVTLTTPEPPSTVTLTTAEPMTTVTLTTPEPPTTVTFTTPEPPTTVTFTTSELLPMAPAAGDAQQETDGGDVGGEGPSKGGSFPIWAWLIALALLLLIAIGVMYAMGMCGEERRKKKKKAKKATDEETGGPDAEPMLPVATSVEPVPVYTSAPVIYTGTPTYVAQAQPTYIISASPPGSIVVQQ